MNTYYWSNLVLDTMYTNNEDINFYIGLSATQPALDGTGVSEPEGNGYARAPISGFRAATNGSITNSETINFPTSTGKWFGSTNLAAYYVIFDGSGSDATVLAAGNLTPPMEIPADTSLAIAPGVLRITLLGTLPT